MNTISVIFPYKFNSQWVFDDETTGLVREAFIAGIDTMLDRATAQIPNASSGFKLVFSASPFPNYTLKLDWRREEYGGNWYWSDTLCMEGWLCPALFKYFEAAPATLFAKLEPKA
ncbi:MAG TPA: DUF6717 family protein [Candidatus Limnocylindria bacterium]|nr:DUF6717 family protein [Candidatus Limnocylindria bacterium]